MPEVIENIDRQRFNEVRKTTVRAAKLWLDLYGACASGDGEGARQIWKQIRDVSVEVSDTLKAIGAEKSGG